MTSIRQGVEAEEVRQAARYILFVEGSSENAIDPEALRTLLDNTPIQIKAMGPSSHIRSVAEALHKHYPYYFFLVDRDFHDDNAVERCWQQFPSEDTCNLLIWRRKELENYFLIPEYLARSKGLHCSIEKLKEHIWNLARERIFLDAANMVIVDCREKMKKKWVEEFSNARAMDFRTKEDALDQLLKKEEFAHKVSDVSEKLHQNTLAQCFEEIVRKLFGGESELTYGKGSWLEMVSGKSLLPTVINRCFRVRARGKSLQGQERLMAVIKELLRLPLAEQPDDFKDLHRLIALQVQSG